MEESKLRKNLELMEKVQKESGVKIILALKGFSMFSTFHIIRQYLKGTTASSLHEARLGFEEFGGEVHAYCPAYLEHEFDEMMSYCGHITFNSINQWEKFKERIQLNQKQITCAIRINPEYSEVKTALYNPCIPGSRLGMRADQMGQYLPEGIDGLHFHSLCENDSYTLEKTLSAINESFGHLIRQCKWFNMGGGHLMTREGYDVDHLIKILKDFKALYPNLEEIIMEPGSAVAWQTGFLLTTVLDVFDSKGIRVAILDASVSAHMPDCIEMPYKPFVIGAEDAVDGKPPYRLGGMTCLAGDYVGDYSFENDLKPGDHVIFDDMMHYTMVKTTTFNGVNLPSIGIVKTDGNFQLIRSFGYQDYKSRLS
jgi:carboxynorspermidine decarboxylase